MRPVHGTMMDPIVARPSDLARTNQRLIEAALPPPGKGEGAQAPLAFGPVAARYAAMQTLVGQWAARQTAQAAQVSTALPALAFDGTAVQESIALSHAVSQQYVALQALWLEGLAELASEAGQLRKTNTMSKYVDQEMHLLQQGLALVTTQATATVRLAENVQNNLAWWLSQRGGGRD